MTDVAFLGRITFSTPVRIALIPDEVRVLKSLERERLFILQYAAMNASLAGIETTAHHVWGNSDQWNRAFRALETIARRHGRTLEPDIVWHSAPEGGGTLVVDEGGLLHAPRSSEDPAAHRTRACSCYTTVLPDLANPTADDTVRIEPSTAGPFTDFVVRCTEHGEVAYAPAAARAAHLREDHLASQHAAAPLPLHTRPALDALAPQARRSLTDAAHALRQARSSGFAQGTYLSQARGHTRHAVYLLTSGGAASVTVLTEALVEQLAADQPPF